MRAKRAANEDTLHATFKQLGATPEGVISQINVRILRVPEQARARVLVALQHNPNIEFAEPNFLVHPGAIPNDPYYSQAYHLPIIGAPTAWDSTVGSSAVTIAILDSGIDVTHPDLAGLLVSGWNFYDNNSNLADVSGHGTAVAGVAAALSNNGQGVAGVTWNCRIMPLRITDATGMGDAVSIANALTYAADHGARVANISYGNVSKISTIVSAAQYFQSKGGVVTAAAGNAGTFDSTADNSYFLLVSATDSTDTLCSWSNTGNNVDLAAPGQNIITTLNGGGYGSGTGTSFSAPIVAGVAALVYSVNPNLTGVQVQNILKNNADDLGAKGWDSSYGWGRVNAARAVAAAGGSPAADTTAPTATVTAPSAGATVSGTVSVTVSGSDNVGVTKVEWYLNGALKGSSTTTPATFSWDTSTVGNGSHSLTAKAYDAASNVGTSSAVSVSVNNPVPDTTAPTVSVTAPAAGATLAGTVSVNVSGSDNVGVTKIEWYLDGALKGSSAAASASFSWDTTTAVNGSHTLSAKAYDAAGNIGSSTSVAVSVNNPVPDTTAPSATVSAPSTGATVGGTTSVTVSASDNVGVTKVEWYLDNVLQGSNPGAIGNFSWNTAGAANGAHSVISKAYDAAGNVGTSATVGITVFNDTTAPTVSVTAPVAGSTVAATISVSVSGSDNVAVTKVEWYLDGALKGSSTGASASFSWDTTTAANGSHSLTGKAYDAAGNVGSSAAVSVTVSNPVPDTTAPSVVINSLAPQGVLAGTVSVSVSASDNVGVTKVEWYLDGTLQGSASGSSANFTWDTTRVANGSHTISAKAYDAAGNVGSASPLLETVNNVVPDTTAPVAVVFSPANGSTVSGVVSVTVSGTDNVGVTSIDLYIDGALVTSFTGASGTYSWSTTPSQNGSHTLSAVAHDAAGNTGTSATVAVTVNNPVPDTTAPVVQITSPATGSSLAKNAKVNVVASDNVGVTRIDLFIDGKLYQSSSTATASFTWNTAKVSTGTHTLQAFAYDAAGNKGSSTTVTVTK